MKYIKIFLIICFFNTHAFSNENEIKFPIRYIDINLIVNDSLVGKKIRKIITDENNKLKNKHKKREEELRNKKNEILSKKNILNEKDFENEVNQHQQNVEKYHSNKRNDLEKLNKKNIELSKNFMVKIDEIVINYAKENSIDLLLKKDALIVSNSQLDISKDILDEVNKKIKKID
jgi:Skp family chaperone for outer membrane proteins|tara:strand:- start:219 stop:743 length:525 start_codon:yes stop_codon:yes gene_type:complete